jgi:hypothetical protein
VLAISALAGGQYLGWSWLDPINRRRRGHPVVVVWPDPRFHPRLARLEASTTKADALRERLEGDPDNRVKDLQLWRIGPHHLGVGALCGRKAR